ncbi:Crp/Fnr family transcriptional regulator [Streptomyces sp. NPDC001450]|uniref:Crp/Fnr family transcriptional regulator n=1 Tax=Streptomyces sp. NPDC005408 TaxID=3155341 RepID=UPI0033A52798
MGAREVRIRRRPMLIGTSLYERNEETGRVDYRVSGQRALLDHNPFLAKVPRAFLGDFVANTSARAYERKQQLRGTVSSMVHIILSGCVAEESTYGEATSVRILGAGAVLGDAEVFNEQLNAPSTWCLNTTYTLAAPLERMRTMTEHNSVIMMALGNSITERLAVGEQVYNRHMLPPEQRLAGLFVHLLHGCAVPNSRFGRMLEGPSQSDLAAALSISRATIETAMRILRDKELVVTGYRTYEFPSERRLAEMGKVRIPSQMVTGEASGV